jgi:type IV pilus assembly protein PilX
MRFKHKSCTFNKQQGALLVVSVLLLLVLTIISISSITATVLQEKTSRNGFNTQRAFHASEASLRIAEDYIRQMTARPTSKNSCTDDCDIIWSKDAISISYGGAYQNNWWAVANATTNDAWWNSKTHSSPSILTPSGVSAQDSLQYVANQPRFIAEELAFIPDDLSPNTRASGVGLNFYRLTSRGTGGEAMASGVSPSQVYLQSIFGKRFN